MRIVDIQLSFPAILVALVLLALLGKGIDKVIIALAIVQWAIYARTVRASAIVERRKEYIEAATSLGLGSFRIIWRHLMPIRLYFIGSLLDYLLSWHNVACNRSLN